MALLEHGLSPGPSVLVPFVLGQPPRRMQGGQCGSQRRHSRALRDRVCTHKQCAGPAPATAARTAEAWLFDQRGSCRGVGAGGPAPGPPFLSRNPPSPSPHAHHRPAPHPPLGPQQSPGNSPASSGTTSSLLLPLLSFLPPAVLPRCPLHFCSLFSPSLGCLCLFFPSCPPPQFVSSPGFSPIFFVEVLHF